MVGLFDVNPALKGKEIRDIQIRMIDELPEFLENHQVDIAALTLPKEKAKEAADLVLSFGVKAIWNFALVDLDVPDDVVVENVHLSDSLMRLSYDISRKNPKEDS